MPSIFRLVAFHATTQGRLQHGGRVGKNISPLGRRAIDTLGIEANYIQSRKVRKHAAGSSGPLLSANKLDKVVWDRPPTFIGRFAEASFDDSLLAFVHTSLDTSKSAAALH